MPHCNRLGSASPICMAVGITAITFLSVVRPSKAQSPSTQAAPPQPATQLSEIPLGDLVTGANRGDASLQAELGTRYVNANGVARDYAEAAKWYRKAAEQGNARAECDLGRLYAAGCGVPKDLSEEARWLKKAVDQGLPRAEAFFSRVLEKGEGVPQDDEEALRLAQGSRSG